MPRARPQELKTLTTLRFFAAFHVLLFHAVPIFFGVAYLSVPRVLANVVDGGLVGVPFFFVLSGFVLAYVYEHGVGSYGDFVRKRYARLAPALYLGVLLGAWHAWRGEPLPFAGGLLANLSFLAGWFPSSLSFNLPAWSLSAEACFYLLFPLLLSRVLALRERGAMIVVVLAVLFALLTQLAVYLAVVWRLPEWPRDLALLDPELATRLLAMPPLHAGEFALGMALARLHALRGPPRNPDAWLLSGAALGFLVIQGKALVPQNLLDPLMLPAIAILIRGAAGARGARTRWLESPRLTRLGEASYGLYILHYPLQQWALLARHAWFPQASGPLLAALFCVAMAGVSLGSLRGLEDPAREALRGRKE